jgi:hypothetical protein
MLPRRIGDEPVSVEVQDIEANARRQIASSALGINGRDHFWQGRSASNRDLFKRFPE